MGDDNADFTNYEPSQDNQVPKYIVDQCVAWSSFLPYYANLNPDPQFVPRTPDADKLLKDFRYEKFANDEYNVGSRSVQKANQLTLIYSGSKFGPNPATLQVDADAARWAIAAVRWCTRNLIAFAGHNIAVGTPYDLEGRQIQFMKWLRKQLAKSKNKKKVIYVTKRDADRNSILGRIGKREREELLESLISSRKIVVFETTLLHRNKQLSNIITLPCHFEKVKKYLPDARMINVTGK
jgi:hypothetical protein